VSNIRDFCENNEFRIALNYHSYSNLLLYPWGFTSDPCPDDDIFFAHSTIMTRENGYAYGAGSTTIYPTNGGSDDWMYGEQDDKDLIYSYTPEVGGSFDGFWPSIDRIIPLCQENMWQNIMAAKLAGTYGTVSDMSPMIIGETTGNFDFEVQRLGLEDNGALTVSITPLNEAISEIGDPVVYDDLDILEMQSGAISYTLSETLMPGDQIEFLLSIDNGIITESDTIQKIFGEGVTVFEDNAENLSNWVSNYWNTTNSSFHSPENSITDSPFGYYNNYENNSMIMIESIDLTEASFALLEFYAKWDIEAGYDYVQVMAADGSSTWTALEGKYTKTGNSNQAEGEPVYDGQQSEWVKEEISLEQFCGSEINLRLILRSDSYVTGDGFYWDDMKVVVVDMTTDLGELNQEDASVKVYPNPARNVIYIDYGQIDKSGLKLFIFNVDGRIILEEDLGRDGNSTRIDISGFSSGLYFYRISGDIKEFDSGKILVQ
jgi:hypothetical protein